MILMRSAASLQQKLLQSQQICCTGGWWSCASALGCTAYSAVLSCCAYDAGSAVGQKKAMGSGSLSLRRPSDPPGMDQRQSSQKGSQEGLPGLYVSAAQPECVISCLSCHALSHSQHCLLRATTLPVRM